MAVVARFYSPQEKPFAVGERALLSEKARHHAGRVIRAVAGDTVALFDGSGEVAAGPIAFEGKDAWITVHSIERPQTESPAHMTLIQAMVSNEKIDFIVEKAVEAGISRIILVPAARSVTKLAGERLEKRLTRWNDIAVAACEQCGRNVVPVIEALPSLNTALTDVKAGCRWFMHPGESDALTVKKDCRSFAFAVGPEGGFRRKKSKRLRKQAGSALFWAPASYVRKPRPWLPPAPSIPFSGTTASARLNLSDKCEEITPGTRFSGKNPVARAGFLSERQNLRPLNLSLCGQKQPALCHKDATRIAAVAAKVCRSDVVLERFFHGALLCEVVCQNFRSHGHIGPHVKQGLFSAVVLKLFAVRGNVHLHKAYGTGFTHRALVKAGFDRNNRKDEQWIKVKLFTKPHGFVHNRAGFEFGLMPQPGNALGQADADDVDALLCREKPRWRLNKALCRRNFCF